jgi:hypothetical protein
MRPRSGTFCLVTFAALALLLVGNLLAFDARAQSQGHWIDVHFHLIADKGNLESFDEAAGMALQIMDTERIQTIIVMSPPRPRENFDIESLADIVRKYGPRIVMFGGGGSLNPMLQEAGKSPEVPEGVRRRFEETAYRIIASGAKGFGEITAHHVSLSPSHGYESVPADHPLLLLLADIASQHDVPIDLHFDPVPTDVEKPSTLSSPCNPAVLKANLGGFERLLAHNRKAKIVCAHAGADPVGYFTPKLVREMLSLHSNLALSIRPTAPFPESMVHPNGAINTDGLQCCATSLTGSSSAATVLSLPRLTPARKPRAYLSRFPRYSDGAFVGYCPNSLRIWHARSAIRTPNGSTGSTINARSILEGGVAGTGLTFSCGGRAECIAPVCSSVAAIRRARRHSATHRI